MPSIPQTFYATLKDSVSGIVHSADETTCTGSCVRNWKIIFCVLLFIEGLVFGHVVFLVRRLTTKSRRVFSIATHFGHSFSAGVFFAAGLLHILPEAVEFLSAEEHGAHDAHEEQSEPHSEVEDESEEEHSAAFPWAYFVVMLGFYFFFFIEKILLPKLFGESFHMHNMRKDPDMTEADLGSASAAEESSICKDNPATSTADAEKSAGAPALESRLLSVKFLIALLQILGLSAHSLFESMALGLSDEFSMMLNVFIATASHRWVTSVAIAFTIASKLEYPLFLIVFVLFSTMVPIGIGIGAALTDLSMQVRGVLFALSAATFLYIGVFETMADEFVVHREMLARKFFITLAGATLITIITGILIASGVHHD